MVKLNCKIEKISKAVNDVEKLLDKRTLVGADFYYKIKRRKKFDMSEVEGEVLCTMLQEMEGQVKVIGYKPWWRWSRALAMVRSDRVIELNVRKLNRSDSSISGSIMHELIHVLDREVLASMGHGNNNRKGKMFTVPYFCGKLAKQILSK